MKYIFSKACILLSIIPFIIVSSCDNKNYTIDDINNNSLASKIQEWLEVLCSRRLSGRKTASYGDSLACEFIKNEITKREYEAEIQFFNTTSGSLLRNIVVSIPGQNDSLIVIGAHYDGAVLSDRNSHYPAADDNASGVLVNLALLDSLHVSKIQPYYSIKCCFWDGEEVFEGNSFWGSRYYVKSLTDPKLIKCYLNFDSVGHNHALYVRHKGYSIVPNFLSIIYSNDRFQYVDVDMNDNNGGGTDYVPFGVTGIPYIGFGGHNGNMCEYKSHSVMDKAEAISITRIIKHVSNIIDLIKS